MNNKKSCPMCPGTVTKFLSCVENYCAWYDKENECCVILTIAKKEKECNKCKN